MRGLTLPPGYLPDTDGEPQKIWELAYPLLAHRLRPENSLHPEMTERILEAARKGGISFDRRGGASCGHEFVYFYDGPDMMHDGSDLGLPVGFGCCCECGQYEDTA